MEFVVLAMWLGLAWEGLFRLTRTAQSLQPFAHGESVAFTSSPKLTTTMHLGFVESGSAQATWRG